MDSKYDGALVALESEMRLNLSVEEIIPLLERDAGGFMIKAERMQVTSVNRENTPEMVSRIVSILRKKGNEQFFIFLNILDNSGNEVWSNKLRKHVGLPQRVHSKKNKDPNKLTIKALMPYIGELASLGLQISGWLDMSNEWAAISKTPGTPGEHLQQLLMEWLNGEEDPDVPHTWKHFIGVVRNCRRGKLAERMEREVFKSQQPSLPSSQRSQPPPPQSVHCSQYQNPSTMYGYHSYVPGQHVPQPVEYPQGQYHSYVPGSGHPVPPAVEEQPGLKAPVQASDPQHSDDQRGQDSYVVPSLPHIPNPYNWPTQDIPANPWHQYSGPNPSFEPGGLNPSFQPGGPNPSFQHGGPNPSFQHGGQNPSFQHGGQNPSFQHGGQNLSFQHGGQNPSFQPGGQNPSFKPGGQNPSFQHGGQNPSFQHGGQIPSFQHGGPNPSFQHGGQNPSFQHGGQNPSFQHGGPSLSFQHGGQNPSFHHVGQYPSYSSYAATKESTLFTQSGGQYPGDVRGIPQVPPSSRTVSAPVLGNKFNPSYVPMATSIEGAQGPDRPHSSHSEPVEVHETSTNVQVLDSKPRESDLLKLVGSKMSADWEQFAMFLGFEGNTRRTIEMDSMRMTDKCFMNAVTLWLQGRRGTGDLPRTWRSVIQAVRDCGRDGLADDVCRSLPRGASSTSSLPQSTEEPDPVFKFLRSFYKPIVDDLDAKAVAMDFHHQDVISEAVRTKIERAYSKREANGIIYDHLCSFGTWDSLRTFCEILKGEDYAGYTRMQQLAEDMEKELPEHSNQ